MPRSNRTPLALRAAAAAATAVAVAVATGGCSAESPGKGGQTSAGPGGRLMRHDGGNATYGSLPSYLPSNSIGNDAPVRGFPGSPAVTSEGDQVLATVGAARAVVEVDGPVVPGEGLPDPPEVTTCTWRVRIRVSGTSLALSVGDFNSLDHLGMIYRVSSVQGQPLIPSTVRPGHPVTFELRAVMPTGEGVMRWSPDHHAILGEWDFTVEND